MRAKVILLMTVFSLCVFLGCAGCDIPSNNDTPHTETGYPKGQVQREMLYYNGIVWGLDFYSTDSNRLSALPDGYVSVGKIAFEDPYNAPEAELHSAHIAVGTEIYANKDAPDAIYVLNDDGIFMRFAPIEIVAD